MSSFLVVFMPNLPIAPRGVEDLIPTPSLSPKEERMLIQELESHDSRAAASAMTRLGRKLRERMDLVVQKLKDPNPQVRAAAIEAIALLRIRSMGSRLYRILLHDPSPLVRGRAAEALGHLGYRKARKALIDMVDKPDIREQLGAIRGLGKLGGRGVLRILAAKLQSPSPELRQAAILAMGDLREKKALRYLIRMLGAPESMVRAAAIRTLACLGYTQLASRLPRYLTSQDTTVVSAALDGAVALRCRTSGCAKGIAHVASGRDPLLSANAILAGAYLNLLTEDEVEGSIRPDLPPEAARRILYGGARLGVAKTLVLALKALDSPIPELRAAAIYAIRLLRPKSLPRPVSSIVKEGMSDPSPDVWQQALLLGVEYGLVTTPPPFPSRTERHAAWLRVVAAVGSSKILGSARGLSDLIQAHPGEFFRAAALVGPHRWEKEASRYLLVGKDPDGVAWAALSLGLTGNPVYRKLLRDVALKRGKELPQLLVAAAVSESVHKGSSFFRFLQKASHAHDRRLALFAAAAIWRGAPVSGEALMTKAFDAYLMGGLNTAVKAGDFDYLSAAFASSFAPWANRASSSKAYVVAWRALVWSREFRNVTVTPFAKPKEVTEAPVVKPKRPKLNLPFKVEDQPREGCGCTTSGLPRDPFPALPLAASWLLGWRRKKNGLADKKKASH